MRKNETAREPELTKTAQIEQHRHGDTRRHGKPIRDGGTRQQRRHDKRNAHTETPTEKTQTGLQHETEERDNTTPQPHSAPRHPQSIKRTTSPARTNRTNETPNGGEQKENRDTTDAHEHELTKTAHISNHAAITNAPPPPPRQTTNQPPRLTQTPPHEPPTRHAQTKQTKRATGQRGETISKTGKTNRMAERETRRRTKRKGGSRSEPKDKAKDGTKTIHNTDTEKPQEKHTPPHATKK